MTLTATLAQMDTVSYEDLIATYIDQPEYASGHRPVVCYVKLKSKKLSLSLGTSFPFNYRHKCLISFVVAIKIRGISLILLTNLPVINAPDRHQLLIAATCIKTQQQIASMNSEK